jgi:Cytochrome P460
MNGRYLAKESIMKTTNASLGSVAFSVLVAVAAFGKMGSLAADSELNAEALADINGNLHVPDGYRTAYQFLGTWAVADDQGRGSVELHSVYASPGAITAYRENGRFPDGAVLVKEVHRASTEPMTTGRISHADGQRGWFVMMKDGGGRYAANPLFWGDGWGWAWFEAGNTSTPSLNLPLPGGGKATSNDYRENCKGCHQPAQATDWIYVNGYPPLKR